MKPQFSIVVPAYNAETTLAETLDAILNQKSRAWECIVVDDGSADETLRIASRYEGRDPRFRVLHQENQGTAGAYNTGVSSAVGEFIVICSADDILLPDHLDAMSAFIGAETGYDIYTSNGFFWWPDNSRETCYGPGLGDSVHSLGLSDVIRQCFYSVGAAYRRELFEKVGGYRIGVYGEDYDFWLRAMALGARHRYLPKPLSIHRLSTSQKSARFQTVYQSDIRLVSELRRDFALSPAEGRAVDEAIQDRERLIAELDRPWSLYRNVLRPTARTVAVRLLGRRRTRQLGGALRSVASRLRALRP